MLNGIFKKKRKTASRPKGGKMALLTSVPVVAGPYSEGETSGLKVLIRSMDDRRGWSLDKGNGGSKSILEFIKKDQGQEGKADIKSERKHGEISTRTLTVPGYQLLEMGPRLHFSRMRNFEADQFERTAYESADAFVYHVRLENPDEYLDGGGEGYYGWSGKGWERDRFQISQLLRRSALVENPQKPLLLLVESKDDDFDVERLCNLFGLCGSTFRRPFRAVTFSGDSDDGTLKESLDWLTKTSNSTADDEATTMTGSDTEEENSVVTSSTSGTGVSSSVGGGGHFIVDYEPTLLGGNPTLQRFEPIKKGTHCPFARGAKLWGGKLPDELKPKLTGRVDSFQEAATLNAGPLAEFVARSNRGEPLDGFCMEIPMAHGRSVEQLGDKVRQLLTHLADLDPAPGENAMKSMGPIDHPHWRFRFAGEDFFLTTFSPAYEKESSRYAFGVSRAFLLFQPLTSFGRHGLKADTPASATNWDNPKTMRDKARVAFRNAGCPYHIPEELPYPVAGHVVKPKVDDGSSCVRWWEPLDTKKKVPN